MDHIAEVFEVLVVSFGKISIAVYIALVVAVIIGSQKANFRRSKFMEYLGNVGPDEKLGKTKTSRSASVSH
ncbi:MAG TPA: hypothetical protein VEV42_02625 [Pyrinomonadaceae bacterium]|jgi:hypothetical protein|nr:hypothetical protein [Pyrinomonadaceae bacterium]